MPWYRLPDGTSAHMNLGGNRAKWPKHCQAKWQNTTEWCACMADFQCDWKIDSYHTCDKHICKAHALPVGNEKHLCPEHQIAYNAWLTGKQKK